ncbi:hypothetical protein ACJRO7_006560 [Eucalyptus globulus]|uniref:Uncharacterized protein n=1 Tax=Eucalyptus globulus TaxID=34317 RepID=A0ABD3II84_EUCGL
MKLFMRVAQFGYLRASYMVGLLFVCESSELKKNEKVGLLRKAYSNGRVVKYCEKYLNSVRNMWWKNTMIFREELHHYDYEMQTEHCKRREWVHDTNHYNDTECEQCICRAETKILYKY